MFHPNGDFYDQNNCKSCLNRAHINAAFCRCCSGTANACARNADADAADAAPESLHGRTTFANPTPFTLNLGPLMRKIYVDGAVTGLGFWQDNATRSAPTASPRLDLE